MVLSAKQSWQELLASIWYVTTYKCRFLEYIADYFLAFPIPRKNGSVSGLAFTRQQLPLEYCQWMTDDSSGLLEQDKRLHSH